MNREDLTSLIEEMIELLPNEFDPVKQQVSNDIDYLLEITQNRYTPTIRPILVTYFICKARNKGIHVRARELSNLFGIKKLRFVKYKDLLINHSSGFIKDQTIEQFRDKFFTQLRKSKNCIKVIRFGYVKEDKIDEFWRVINKLIQEIPETYLFSKYIESLLIATSITLVHWQRTGKEPKKELGYDVIALTNQGGSRKHIRRSYYSF